MSMNVKQLSIIGGLKKTKLKQTLFDCEKLIIDGTVSYGIFDCYLVNGAFLKDMKFMKRLEYGKKVENLFNIFIKKFYLHGY